MTASREVLLLSPVTPADGGNGLAMRAGLFLEGLARSHAVRVLVAPVFSASPTADGLVRGLGAGFDVLDLESRPDPLAVMTARLATPAGRRRANALAPLPALSRQATPAAAEAVALAAQGAVAVHVMRLYLAPLLDALLDRPDRPRLVLDVDDRDATLHRQLGDADEAERYERLEAHYLPAVDHVVTCSAGDARALRRRYGLAAVTAVPNAVRRPGRPTACADRHDLIFVGNLSYAPNVDAACWLCQEVVPLLGNVTVALVGSRPAPAVRALAAGPGVTVAADVPDVGPWYAGATVAVVPIRLGAGTRTKTVEALAHRRPVVATTRGAEGLGLGGAQGPVVVRDTAQDFAAACRQLLDDPDRGARLAARGERIVRASATVDRVAGSIDRLFRNMLAG